jgi:hypothetical protein
MKKRFILSILSVNFVIQHSVWLYSFYAVRSYSVFSLLVCGKFSESSKVFSMTMVFYVPDCFMAPVNHEPQNYCTQFCYRGIQYFILYIPCISLISYNYIPTNALHCIYDFSTYICFGTFVPSSGLPLKVQNPNASGFHARVHVLPSAILLTTTGLGNFRFLPFSLSCCVRNFQGVNRILNAKCYILRRGVTGNAHLTAHVQMIHGAIQLRGSAAG